MHLDPCPFQQSETLTPSHCKPTMRQCAAGVDGDLLDLFTGKRQNNDCPTLFYWQLSHLSFHLRRLPFCWLPPSSIAILLLSEPNLCPYPPNLKSVSFSLFFFFIDHSINDIKFSEFVRCCLAYLLDCSRSA